MMKEEDEQERKKNWKRLKKSIEEGEKEEIHKDEDEDEDEKVEEILR